jgi:hypothetical protein
VSIVRDNLMTRPYYSPYCGREGKCSGHWPRMHFNGEQFKCIACGYETMFEKEFIEEYKVKAKELVDELTPEQRIARRMIESL